MKKLSLKTRLILSFALIAGIVLCIAAFFSWEETNEKTNEFFDTYQVALARQLAAADWNAIQINDTDLTDELIDDIDNGDTEDEAIGFAVFNQQGDKIFHDGENGRYFPYAPTPDAFSTHMIDDEEWRIVWVSATHGPFMIAVGQEAEYRADIAWEMMEVFTFPWGVGIACLLGVMIVIITLEFWPINRLAAHLRNRRGDDLSPISDDGLPTEIKPLTHAMNLLLKKIQETMERERSFIADSAHELRTPLTALKIQLEIIQLAPEDEKTRTEALNKLSIGIDRAARLVEQLLALSRAESALRSDTDTQIDWDKIVTQTVADYTHAAEMKDISLFVSSDKTGPFSFANPILAALIVRNLLDNAIRYSPQGAKVYLTLCHKKLHVLNTQTHVDEAILSRLSHRFYRPAGQKQKGSGLGLSIVERIAHLYHASLQYHNTPDGFEVVISARE